MKNNQKRKIVDLIMSAILVITLTFCGILTIALVPEEPAMAASSELDLIEVDTNLHQYETPAEKATTLAFKSENANIRMINLANVIEPEVAENIEEEVFDVDNSRSPSMSAMNEEENEVEDEVIEVEELPVNHDDYYFGMIEYTEEDIFYVAAEIYAESRGEPYTGKVAVGATIVNRYMDENFPNTIYGVITQEDQFASISWITKEMIDQVPDCWEAAIEALNGIDPTFERTGEHALYFYNPAGCDQYQLNARANIKNPCTIGAHVFYRNW